MRKCIPVYKLSLLTWIAVLATPASASHVLDMMKDATYWDSYEYPSQCPGPHLESIFFVDHKSYLIRECVEPGTYLRLPNGTTRARFVRIHQKSNGHIFLKSEYLAVNCDNAMWTNQMGYQVSNRSGSYNYQLKEFPNWYHLSGKNNQLSHRIGPLDPNGYWGSPVKYINAKVSYLCPAIKSQ